jgi:hypothetical protein
MVLDRALTLRLLDVALRVATESGSRPDARRLLTVALRDHVSALEATGKTKKCLTRVWVHPPAAATEMIHWAVDHQHYDPDRICLHLGALLATFPFFGMVASLIGRQLHLEGVVEPPKVRAEVAALLGERSTIDVGARKVMTTFRYLGLLQAEPDRQLVPGARPVVPSELTGWMTHALLLTRQLSAVGLDEPSRAFEFATVKVNATKLNGYPLLEAFNEGSRTVAAVRRRPTSVCH